MAIKRSRTDYNDGHHCSRPLDSSGTCGCGARQPVAAPPAREPWECLRCHRINACWVEQCNCQPCSFESVTYGAYEPKIG